MSGAAARETQLQLVSEIPEANGCRVRSNTGRPRRRQPKRARTHGMRSRPTARSSSGRPSGEHPAAPLRARHRRRTKRSSSTPSSREPPEEGQSRRGPAYALFDTASADGSRVFFTDTQRLTSDSRGSRKEARRPLRLRTQPRKPDHRRDGDRSHAEGAAPACSANSRRRRDRRKRRRHLRLLRGERSARARRTRRLGTAPPTGQVRPAGTTCNLYVRHYDERRKLGSDRS